VSEQAIDQGRERFLEAWLTNDPDALMRELDDDVVFMPPGHEPARGMAAVRAWFEAAIAEAATVSLEMPEREVVVAGDWGIESGIFVWMLLPVGGSEQFAVRGIERFRGGLKGLEAAAVDKKWRFVVCGLRPHLISPAALEGTAANRSQAVPRARTIRVLTYGRGVRWPRYWSQERAAVLDWRHACLWGGRGMRCSPPCGIPRVHRN